MVAGFEGLVNVTSEAVIQGSTNEIVKEYPLSVLPPLKILVVTVTVTEVVAKLAVLELMVTARPETENQSVPASVGLKDKVSAFVHVMAPASAVCVQAGTLNA